MEDEVVSQSGLLQLPLTVKVSKDGQIDLLEDVLVGATLAEGVLAPSTDPTPFAGKVLEGIRQTYWGYVSISGKVNKTIQLNDRNVVVQVTRIVFWMNLHVKNIELNVGEELAVVVDVPLAQPHPELLRPVLLDTVSSSQEVSSINQTSATDVNIVVLLLLKQRHLPRVLPELGVALCVLLGGVVDPPVDTVGVPPPALPVLAELGLGARGQAVQGLAELLRLLPDVSDGVGVHEALVKAGVDETVETAAGGAGGRNTTADIT